MNTNIIDERKKHNGMSVGTSLMLETIMRIPKYDADRATPLKADGTHYDVNDYGRHIINTHLIIRNVLNSIKSPNKEKLFINTAFYDAIVSELHMIKEMYNGYKCQLQFFVPTYNTVFEHMGKDKPPNISWWVGYTNYIKITNQLIKEKLPIYTGVNGYHFHKDDKNNVLISTSYPVDLLNAKRMKSLTLLESNTGSIKVKSQWNTKYHPIGKDRPVDIIPFMEKILWLLGDNHMVSPGLLIDRRELWEIAKTRGWTSITSDTTVMDDIRKTNNTLYRKILYRNLLY